tara:strand:+ start:59 stop:478 length:420 start_codon:yes stop_codon:yes gene_type:complete
MNNKRIDLTQFEGMTKGEWVYHEGEDRFMGKTAELHIPHPALDNEIHRLDGEPINGTIRQPIEGAWPKKEDIKAMSLTPALIAGLKRCYERLDMANEAMLTAREVLMKHHEWMSVNDSTSEEDDQEILDVVKALREASE